MDKCPEDMIWCLLCVIVNRDSGSRVLKIARNQGVTGGTILMGHGTVGNRYSKWFDNYEIRKEIVLMISSTPHVEQTMDKLNQIMKLNKPNHGIAFTMSVASLLGSSNCRMDGKPIQKGASTSMLQAIFVIVDIGDAEVVVTSAEAAGARGATVLHGRGAGIHETSKLFSMEIEPEKEIVLILADSDITDAITAAIFQHTHLNDPGKGILFVIDVQKAYGMFDKL